MADDSNNSFDPFAVLRAIENGHADLNDSSSLADLFAGSEPVPMPTEPAATPAEPPSEPAAAVEPVAAQLSGAGASPLVSSTLDAATLHALLQLDARVAALEMLAKRNGWPL